MFKFKQTISPAVAYQEKLGTVLQIEDTAERTEQLLALKEESAPIIIAAANKGTDKAQSLFTSFIGACVLLGAFGVPPVFILGGMVAATVAVIPVLIKTTNDDSRLRREFSVLQNKIDQELAQTFETSPEAMLQSPRFLRGIKAAFNAITAPAQNNSTQRPELKAPTP